MKHASFFTAALITMATPALAEAPRILTLQGNSEAILPGAHDGGKHGVTVRRGSGFRVPIAVEAPTVVEDAPVRKVRKKTKKKRKRGW